MALRRSSRRGCSGRMEFCGGACNRERADSRGTTAHPCVSPRIRRGFPRGLRRVLFIIPLVIVAATGWAHRFVTDDGFIYFRTVNQLTAGNGPVYNVGQRVESLTSRPGSRFSRSPHRAPIRLEWIAIAIGIAGSVAGLALAMAGAATLARVDAPDALLVPFRRARIRGDPSGVAVPDERPRNGARVLLGGAVRLSVGRLGPHGRAHLVVGARSFSGSAGSSDRSWPCSACCSSCWSSPCNGARIRGVTGSGCSSEPRSRSLSPTRSFESGTTARSLSNTAIAKGGRHAQLARGAFLPLRLRPPLLAVGARADTDRRRVRPTARVARAPTTPARYAVVLTIVTAGLLDGLYVVAVGGDYIHGRLFLPGVSRCVCQ